MDPNNPIITLPDGTTAHVQGMATVINNPSPLLVSPQSSRVLFQIQSSQGEGGTPVHTIQTLAEGTQGEVVDLTSVTEATLNSEGQIILTGEDGHGKSKQTLACGYSVLDWHSWFQWVVS